MRGPGSNRRASRWCVRAERRRGRGHLAFGLIRAAAPGYLPDCQLWADMPAATRRRCAAGTRIALGIGIDADAIRRRPTRSRGGRNVWTDQESGDAGRGGQTRPLVDGVPAPGCAGPAHPARTLSRKTAGDRRQAVAETKNGALGRRFHCRARNGIAAEVWPVRIVVERRGIEPLTFAMPLRSYRTEWLVLHTVLLRDRTDLLRDRKELRTSIHVLRYCCRSSFQM